jgi:toxin-antitoxin system PIN domain toxin
MRSLLDVNVLIAALDSAHEHHAKVRVWMAREADAGWASCPITQNGCLRVMSQPAYPGKLPLAQVAARLRAATQHPGHSFWPDDLSLLDRGWIDEGRLAGHRQVTDAYLLALAVRRGGRFVTFDARVPLAAVQGASGDRLVVL